MDNTKIIEEEEEKKGDDSIYFIDGYLRESTKKMKLFQNIPNEIKYIILKFSANTFVIGYGYSDYFEVGSIKIDNIVKCASFDNHSLFVDIKGNVCGIGKNAHYQLGLNHNDEVSVPQLLSIDAIIVEVAVGSYHSILLCDKGCIYTMGYNKYNQCAQGNEQYIRTPTKCEYFSSMNVVKISAGGMHSACITSDNSVYLFGLNEWGQCGVGKEMQKAKIPHEMNLWAKSLSCGGGHTFIITTNNKLYACGWNEWGQIGNGAKNDQFGFIQIELPHNVIDAKCGVSHSLCILEDGAAYSWGKGTCGQLGHGDNNHILVPTQIRVKNRKFKKCVAGLLNSCLIDDNDNFYCFGGNDHGELCVGDKKDKRIPTMIEKKNVVDISMGHRYSFLMIEDNFCRLKKPTFIKISALKPISVGFTVTVRVGKIKPIINRLNLDGTRLRISEALIGDETASILLSLRNDQIGLVEEGKCYILRNAKINMVTGGTMRVAVDRWGLIEAVDAENCDLEIDENKENLSLQEYELVQETASKGAQRGRGRGRGRGRRGRRDGGRGRSGGRL